MDRAAIHVPSNDAAIARHSVVIALYCGAGITLCCGGARWSFLHSEQQRVALGLDGGEAGKQLGLGVFCVVHDPASCQSLKTAAPMAGNPLLSGVIMAGSCLAAVTVGASAQTGHW